MKENAHCEAIKRLSSLVCALGKAKGIIKIMKKAQVNQKNIKSIIKEINTKGISAKEINTERSIAREINTKEIYTKEINTKEIILKGTTIKDTMKRTVDYKIAALTLAVLLLIPTATACGNKNISESANIRSNIEANENSSMQTNTEININSNTQTNTETNIDSNTQTNTEANKESNTQTNTETTPDSKTALNHKADQQTAQGQIFLYGETHSQEKILEKELEIWGTYYHENGMRDLFVELPYYTAEFLNLWMKAEDDTILEELFQDFEGTEVSTPQVKAFYKKIKENYPNTIFHGTDVGHQYNTTGKRYMEYLLSSDSDKSEECALCQEAIDQGQYYYEQNDSVYRENKMVENFKREYSKLNNRTDIMGIYGSGHTSIEGLDYATQTIPCMANQLKQLYGELVSTKDLTMYAYDIDPIRTEAMQIGGKTYQALYYGKQDLSEIFPQYQCREFWRLENAYNDFKDSALTGEYLPYHNYIMLVEEQQVFVIDYTSADGSVERQYFRSDGNSWEGTATTERFVVE